ncbi:MAG TPA: beta-propeller fold lactonase family protein [Terriglobales bacterium]|nr:beta-propeller fold lactonase family protein [Terriglobales bacterium]
MKSRMLALGLALAGLGLVMALTSCSSSSSSPSSSTPGFIYITTQGDNSLSEFELNASTGIPAKSGNSIAAGPSGSMPTAMVLSPLGNAIFVANSVPPSSSAPPPAGAISAFTVNSDGSATTTSGTSAAGQLPAGLAMDSGGKFLFVANQGIFTDPASGTISVFSVQGTTLSEVAGSPFPTALLSDSTGTGPVALALTPDGKYLYAASQFTNTVRGFAVDGSGALTPLPAASYNAGTNPSGVLVTPDGNFLYVANAGSNSVSAFVICDNPTPDCPVADGHLTEVAGSPFSTGLGPRAMAATADKPVSKFLYVMNWQSNQIAEFKIAAGTGVLSANTSATISTGLNPAGLTLLTSANPSANAATTGGTLDYIYAVNNGASTISAFSFDNTVGVLSIVGTSTVATGGQPTAVAGH